MTNDTKQFWTSVPGILTGAAALLTAVTSLYLAVTSSSQRKPAEAQVEPSVNTTPQPADLVSATDLFVLRAVINDPDGFTHVRSSRNASSESIARISQDEQFSTYVQDGSWWQVKTHDGKIGYMHASRIKLVARK